MLSIMAFRVCSSYIIVKYLNYILMDAIFSLQLNIYPYIKKYIFHIIWINICYFFCNVRTFHFPNVHSCKNLEYVLEIVKLFICWPSNLFLLLNFKSNITFMNGVVSQINRLFCWMTFLKINKVHPIESTK